MKICGKVEKRFLARGTKSEHEGLVLVSGSREYKLLRKGGNPFWDETLAGLAGKEILAEGEVRENRFIMESWEAEGILVAEKPRKNKEILIGI